MRKVDRDVERDRNKLEREEKKLELEIKKAAKTGNKQATTVLAKQLIQLRKQKTRTFTAQSQIRGAKNQAHAMGANAKLAETMYVLIHVFTNPGLYIFDCFFEKKFVLEFKITVILAFYNLF